MKTVLSKILILLAAAAILLGAGVIPEPDPEPTPPESQTESIYQNINECGDGIQNDDRYEDSSQ